MRRTVKILHLASFSGNIGDNANHMGFRPWFERQIDREVKWTDLEIREFYWGHRKWDQSLVEYVNCHDLMVIGGGNYFELWVENSPTGTSIAIEPALLDCIRVPVFFNALGVDPGQGVPERSRRRFAAFLDRITGSGQYLVSLRNDGAMDNLERYIGTHYRNRVHRLPDHGFFVRSPVPEPGIACGRDADRRRICINLASDMGNVRFAGFDDQSGFAREMAEVISALAEDLSDVEFIFVPHIFRDLEVITQTIRNLEDWLRRTRVSLAPYGCGDEAAKKVLSAYSSADLVLGMRFHANVCPMALGRNVLGLTSYPQIENLYRELGQTDRLIGVSWPGFRDQLVSAATRTVAGHQRFSGTAREAGIQVHAQRRSFEPKLAAWFADAMQPA